MNSARASSGSVAPLERRPIPVGHRIPSRWRARPCLVRNAICRSVGKRNGIGTRTVLSVTSASTAARHSSACDAPFAISRAKMRSTEILEQQEPAVEIDGVDFRRAEAASEHARDRHERPHVLGRDARRGCRAARRGSAVRPAGAAGPSARRAARPLQGARRHAPRRSPCRYGDAPSVQAGSRERKSSIASMRPRRGPQLPEALRWMLRASAVEPIEQPDVEPIRAEYARGALRPFHQQSTVAHIRLRSRAPTSSPSPERR